MSEHDDSKQQKDIRRLGPKDRKEQLPRTELVFPPDIDPVELASQAADIDAPPPDMPDFDIDALPLPDRDAEAQAILSTLGAQHVRPLIIPPESERFPPIAPDSAPPPKLPKSPKPAPAPHRLRDNLLTLLFSFGTIAVLIIYAIIWNDPQTPLNPFPPNTPFIVVTATQGSIAPAETDASPLALTPSSLDSALFPFIVAPEGPLYVANSTSAGCNWSSIAGTVIGLEGEPRNGLAIRIQGDGLDERVFSGSVQTFGPGGFELALGGAPTNQRYTVTLLTPAGVPLSEPIVVETRADCDANVVVIPFIQIQAF